MIERGSSEGQKIFAAAGVFSAANPPGLRPDSLEPVPCQTISPTLNPAHAILGQVQNIDRSVAQYGTSGLRRDTQETEGNLT